MKTILCFGDSNTFGYDPVTGDRFPFTVRWPGVLQARLGPEWRVIEEGLNHRTAVWDDPLNEGRNGRTYLLPCLLSHRPLDRVILLLGSNDLKAQFNLPPAVIAAGIGILVDLVRSSACGPRGGIPEILILPPPCPGQVTCYRDWFTDLDSRTRALPPLYAQVAAEKGVRFLDTSFVRCPDTDGIHLDGAGHRQLAEAVADFLVD
jgi:lysophospholipase L1-like esterase